MDPNGSQWISKILKILILKIRNTEGVRIWNVLEYAQRGSAEGVRKGTQGVSVRDIFTTHAFLDFGVSLSLS